MHLWPSSLSTKPNVQFRVGMMVVMGIVSGSSVTTNIITYMIVLDTTILMGSCIGNILNMTIRYSVFVGNTNSCLRYLLCVQHQYGSGSFVQ